MTTNKSKTALIDHRDPMCSDELFAAVYEELHALAKARMALERQDHTLQATSLIHEAYVRLADVGRVKQWENRKHFFVAVAAAMHRILIDHAREKSAQKRGGKRRRLNIDSAHILDSATPEDLIVIDEALEKLVELDPIACQLIKLRYFAGLSIAAGAEHLGVSLATAYRHWSYARAWLHVELAVD